MDRSSVLVAEPDPLQRQLIDVMLSAGAREVVLVGSGQEALAYLREHTPAAMLVAADLTDIDGFALCRKVKVVGRLTRVPVVLLYTRDGEGADERARSQARSAGAELLLQRPLGDKNLLERIERLISAPVPDPGLHAMPLADPSVSPTPWPEAVEPVASGTSHGPHAQGHLAATELGGLRAEVVQLRGENASLKTRLAKYKSLAQNLQAELDAERKRPRGLFGRRG